MAQVTHGTQLKAINAAVTDGGKRNVNVRAYGATVEGVHANEQSGDGYAVLHIGKDRYVALKGDGNGTWTEV